MKPTLKIDFIQISDYESHALLPGLQICLLSPQSLLNLFVSENVGESKQFRRPGSSARLSEVKFFTASFLRVGIERILIEFLIEFSGQHF